MPPVIILKPLLWTDSRSSSSVPEQLQNIMLPYSNPGLTKHVYIVVNVFLSIKVFSVAKMFNFLLAFSQIVLQWSFHVRFEFISIPRCLCFVTVSKSEFLDVRGNSMVSLFFIPITMNVTKSRWNLQLKYWMQSIFWEVQQKMWLSQWSWSLVKAKGRVISWFVSSVKTNSTDKKSLINARNTRAVISSE